MDRIVTFYLNG